MEEKERYSWYNHSTEEIYDNKDDIVFVGAITVLNQQNRRIWELIEENQQLKYQVKKSYQEGLLQKQFDKDMEIQELKDKIETLKQSQKQLAIEELEKLREYIVLNDEYDEEIGCNIIETFDLIEDLADKIKSLKGEE